jgi:SAM-dependent methyltransferase
MNKKIIGKKIPKQIREIRDILVCPYCKGSINFESRHVICFSCAKKYMYTKSGAIDLNLRDPISYSVEFQIENTINLDKSFDCSPLKLSADSQIPINKIKRYPHLSKEIISYFPRPEKKSIVLDLGCGNSIHKKACEELGYYYVGMDHKSTEASVLADMHAIPFKDNTFDLIICFGVMQYSKNPFVLIREVQRVLKPKGKFIGTVAFMEPFHKTYYHHSHLGVINSLRCGGLKVEKVAASKDWQALNALASMALFPRMPKLLTGLLIMPLDVLHKIWWFLGGMVDKKSNRNTRLRNTSGTFTFISEKI